MKREFLFLSGLLMLCLKLNAEIIKVDIKEDTFISKSKPEFSLRNVKFGGIRSWWSYYLFKISTEELKKKLKGRKIKDAYFNFYISYTEVLPRGFSPSETKTEILFYPLLTEWKEDATWLYPSLENKEIKWNGLKRGRDYPEKPIVIYKIENKDEKEIKGKNKIGGFAEILKLWINGKLKNNGILVMIKQIEKNTPYLIQINIHTTKETNKERIPFMEVEVE